MTISWVNDTFQWGISVEKNLRERYTKEIKPGDIIGAYHQYKTNEIIFKHNYSPYETLILKRIPREQFFPCFCMHGGFRISSVL